MILNKPKFWDQEKGFFSFLLTPISLLIRIIIYVKKKIIKSKNFNIPIICVGNIYLGGTGKTPAAILLANEQAVLSDLFHGSAVHHLHSLPSQ